MNIPLDPSLFIAFSLFIGLALSGLFNLSDKIEKEHPLDPDVILPLLLKVGLVSIVIIVIITYLDKEVAKALSPTLIVLSAFIASASVMKSINAQKRLANERNKRLRKRNISILCVDMESLLKEIDEQLSYLQTPVEELVQYRYSEHLNNTLLYNVVEKITGLEINEYNSYETIDTISKIKKIVFERIQMFDVMFRKIELVENNELESDIKFIIKENSICNFENTTPDEQETRVNSLVEKDIHKLVLQKGFSFSFKDVTYVLKYYDEINQILVDLKIELNKDKQTINNFRKKLLEQMNN